MIKDNERIARLRKEMVRKPELCIERGLYYTQAYKENESEPYCIKRAKAQQKVLENMTIVIEPDELIVGRATSKRRGAPLIPEVNGGWYLDGLKDMSTRAIDQMVQLPADDEAKMREFMPYWNGKTLYDKWIEKAPEDYKQTLGRTHLSMSSPSDGQHKAHVSPGFDLVVHKGFRALKQEVIERKKLLDSEISEDKDSKQKWLDSVIICIDAVITYANRYSSLAAEMARKETNPKRKSELERIAEICAYVPENPARTFHEALQGMWFTYIALMLEGWGMGMSFGRVDQYLYSIYKNDIDTGRLTRDEAGELIACLLIQMNGVCNFFSAEAARNGPGFPMISNLTVGGVTPRGKCAVNDLSYLVIEAESAVGLPSEDIVVRVNRNTPNDFLIKACEVAKDLHGKFKFISDDTAIMQLLSDGKTPEMARDYVVVGCNFPSVARYSLDLSGDCLSLAKCLELALNNGRCRLRGDLIGLETGNPREFTTYEQVWEAYKAQVEYLDERIYPQHIYARQCYAEMAPQPFQSVLTEGCVDKCVDITAGGSCCRTDPLAGGAIVNVADSLAAIKRAVFEDQSITMAQLIDALDKNFEGEQRIWKILDRCPKFGNDDEYVDSIANEVLIHFADMALSKKPPYGAKGTATAAYATMNIGLGLEVGALPDGRKATMPLADAGLSPSQGKNVSGATATINSVTSLDLLKVTNGSVLNMRFGTEAVADDEKVKKFSQLIRAFCEQGGFLIQFNVISSSVLKDAMLHPNEYSDLLVRVATWSAYFVELPEELQRDIIARLEFEEVQ